MTTTIEQQTALDESLVPSSQRLRIGRSNFRFPSDIQSKEATLQVVYDVNPHGFEETSKGSGVGHMTYFQDYEWYDNLLDGKINEEALKQKAIYERSWGDATQGKNDEEMELNNDHGFSNFDKDLVQDNAHYHEEEEQYEEDRSELLENPRQEPSVCKVRKFEMIKHSFESKEEYVAIKEHEYDDLTRANEDACHAYQEIFHIMDE
nr:hypothetical protein [Tanacetum cinerariifolium]